MTKIYTIAVPEGEDVTQISDYLMRLFQTRVLEEVTSEDAPVVVHEDPQTVYRGDNSLFVLSTKIKNPAGEMVRGHSYTVGTPDKVLAEIQFQNGPVPANGVNGVTNESLLAIVIDRTEILNGLFPSSENEVAIDNMKSALQSFEERTKKRRERGVEGQLKA